MVQIFFFFFVFFLTSFNVFDWLLLMSFFISNSLVMSLFLCFRFLELCVSMFDVDSSNEWSAWSLSTFLSSALVHFVLLRTKKTVDCQYWNNTYKWRLFVSYCCEAVIPSSTLFLTSSLCLIWQSGSWALAVAYFDPMDFIGGWWFCEHVVLLVSGSPRQISINLFAKQTLTWLRLNQNGKLPSLWFMSLEARSLHQSMNESMPGKL